MNYLVGFCGLLLLALTIVAWRLDVVSRERDAADLAAVTARAANVTLTATLATAERAAKEREARLRQIESALNVARSTIRKAPTDACVDTPVHPDIAGSLRH